MNEWYLSSLFQGGTCSRTVNKCLANKQSYKYIFFEYCRIFKIIFVIGKDYHLISNKEVLC